MRAEKIISDWNIFYSPVWAEDFEEKSKTVELPRIWQMDEPDYEGAVYYWRKFNFTAEDLELALRLRFGAVNYRAEVEINGRKAAFHEGGYTPFEVRLDGMVHAGENLVTVRVVCPPRMYPYEGLQASCPIRQTPVPSWKTGWYYPFGGIWQEVKLIKSPKIFVANVFIRPEIDPPSISVTVTLSEKTSGILTVEIKGFESRQIPFCGDKIEFDFNMPGAELWSLENPALHILKIEFNGEETDWRFGLRKFSCANGKFYLNGKFVFLRGILQQGLYPGMIAAPMNREFAVRELELIKKANINLIRAHLKPTPEYMLDLYDEAGILVIAEPPVGWVSYDDKVEERVRNEVEYLVLRDRNHPCVILWTFFNEFTDTVYARDKDPAKLVKECCELGVKLDPTRLATGNSGSSPDMHASVGFGIFGQGLKKAIPLTDEHIYCRAPLNSADAERLRRISPGKDALLWVSEFGTSSFPDMDKLLDEYGGNNNWVDYRQNKLYRDSLHNAFVDFELDKCFGNEKEFYRLLGVDQNMMTDAMLRSFRANPDLAGYNITQWADAASEWGGIVDLFRNPKSSYYIYAKNNADVNVIIAVEKPLIYAGSTEEITLYLSNVGDKEVEYQGIFRIILDGEVLLERNIKAKGGIVQLDKISFCFERPGKYSLELSGDIASDRIGLTAVKNIIGELPPFSLLENTAPPRTPISPLREKLQRLGLYPANQFEQFNPPPEVPAVVHMQGKLPSLRLFRSLQVLRKEVEEEGKTAIFIDCDLGNLSDFFGEDRPLEFYAVGCYAGNYNLAMEEGIFSYADEKYSINRAYSEFYPAGTVDAYYLKSRGYRLHAIGVHPEQFGIESQVQYGSFLASKQIGKGRIVLCSMRIFDRLGSDPAADDLLMNLLRKFS